MIKVTNTEFLQAVFGEDAPWAYVTDFKYDPGNIPQGLHMAAWSGDYASRYPFSENSNQYFTISTFYSDEGKARRRKALFRYTHTIVLDDVKTKLSHAEALKLPPPSWILETSEGNEQWGYILDTPCTSRDIVDNLLDGLISSGLAPDGKDSGMKGVTRFVRLPEGWNNKAIYGTPFKCAMLVWSPENKVTMEQLAAPFSIDLRAVRRLSSVSGASDIPDHPLLNTNMIRIKSSLSAGRWDCTCPWVDEHTGGEDSGTAIFTNEDGSMGFCCHHGNCDQKTGKNLMNWLEARQAGFGRIYKDWQVSRAFKNIVSTATVTPGAVGAEVTQVAPVVPRPPVTINFLDAPAPIETIDDSISQLRSMIPTTPEAKDAAGQVLRLIDTMNPIDRLQHHKEISDIMRWSKTELKEIMTSLRTVWYQGDVKDRKEFYKGVVFIREMNQFYEQRTGIFYTPDAFQSAYADEDEEARKGALQMGLVMKVDKLDYLPNGPTTWEEDGVTYGNSYIVSGLKGIAGPVDRWIDHWEAIGWTDHKEHMLDWMAYTVQFPENKINHMLLLGGGEGTGKDYLLYPLTKAMGRNGSVIDGSMLLSQFNDYLMGTKYLHINETELGDHKEATAISNKLKPIAAAPPNTLHVNPKGTKGLWVRNIVNGTMTTNSLTPFKSEGVSRRFYGVWTDLRIRGMDQQMLPAWTDYWCDRWNWMLDEGVDACVHFLRSRDVSKFNPFTAPPMTEFLSEIAQQSKPATQQTLEAFIEMEIGAFGQDIARLKDLTTTVRAGDKFHPDIMYTRAEYFTPNRIAIVLKKMGMRSVQARRGNDNFKVWIIRNEERYAKMDAGWMLDEYLRGKKKWELKSVG